MTLMILLILVVGCGETKSTATPVPPTPMATDVPLVETPTPAPSPMPTKPPASTALPTATTIPPTATTTPIPSPTPTRAPAVEKIRDVSYVVDGDPEQQLDVYLPTSENGPYPALLVIHGGGGDKRDLARLALHFVKLDYAVVSINHRTMPQDKYPAQVQDAFCALAWMHANADDYGFDPQRFVALGHSSGGTLAAMLGTVDDPALYLEGCSHSLPEAHWVQGVVPFTGIFDYASAAASSSELRSYINSYLDAEQEAAPEIWAAASPIAWIDGSEPPFLLVHGAADNNINPDESLNFVAALEVKGVEVELLLIPGADHSAIVKSEQALEAVEAFLEALNSQSALSITIVYDNTTYDPSLRAEWGFAAWLEYDGHTVLFDTGGDSPTLLGNMEKLGLDPQQIEAVVLSHIHGDHVGGLQGLLDTGARPTVYVPALFPDDFKDNVRAQTELVEVKGALEILPGLHSTGEFVGLVCEASRRGIEQALVVETQEGSVVITGCAHPGVVRIVRRAKEIVDGDVALVVGGFHLGNAGQYQIECIISDFRELGVRQVSPVHCSGEGAITMFADAYGDDYVQGGVGRVIIGGTEPPSPH